MSNELRTEKPDVFSAQSFLTWLKVQNPKEEYNFWDTGFDVKTWCVTKGCAIIQYLRYCYPGQDYAAYGILYPRISDKFCGSQRLGGVACSNPRTFGALRSRIEEAMQNADA